MAFGATDADLEALRAAAEDADRPLGIWPENWSAVQVFLGMASQWRLIVGAAGTHWQGLRYEALEAVLRLTLVPRAEWPETFHGVRIMEAAARDVLNERTTR